MKKTNMQNEADIIIVGGGIVGSLLALALAKQTSFSIYVLEAQNPVKEEDETTYYHRVSSLSLAVVRVLKNLNVWPFIQSQRVSPFETIKVWLAQSKEELVFEAQEIGEPQLGYIIENNLLLKALHKQILTQPKIKVVTDIQLKNYQVNDEAVILTADDGTSFCGQLAIAADGSQSWLRSQAGIEQKVKDYQQTALVTHVESVLPHQKIASQVFLPSGPLAFLPLAIKNLSSIVWSLPPGEASYLKTLTTEQFNKKVCEAFDNRLGEIVSHTTLYTFPLQERKSISYISDKLVLVGDAAHTIHPLAGQGLNLGILDAVSLAQVISEASKANRKINSRRVLKQYARWRQADNSMMQIAVDTIHKFTHQQNQLTHQLCGLGWHTVKRWQALKKILTKQAVGNRMGLPELAQYN